MFCYSSVDCYCSIVAGYFIVVCFCSIMIFICSETEPTLSNELGARLKILTVLSNLQVIWVSRQ